MRIEDDINMKGSALDTPREPKFYPDESKLPFINCNIPMPSHKNRRPYMKIHVRFSILGIPGHYVSR